ncbi:uncharacterized protein LOC108920623 [Scleropages formosus]|uniref:uncharacterized protein LOC108920623 n=1 Tax=Scleropages formosus TaxID=113540 RepID=UPI00087853E1|nr:uncharacterized protein LOC108920623 [Scleropages formosus]
MASTLAAVLFLPLILAIDNEFQVKQSRRIGISPNGSVTIVCECSKNDTKDWKLEMKLEKESDSEWFCMASEHGTSKENCIVKQKDWKRVEFTLTNLESDHFDIYICKFTREKPVPIVEKQGTGTIVYPGSHCTESSLLTWILIGVAALFCVCSLSLTCAYIMLKREMGDPDGNAEYVDMRKVRPVGRGSSRDVNYNSHQVHGSFFVGQ